MFNQSFASSADQATCNVVRFIMHETGTFDQQFRRPYQSVLDAKTMGVLKEVLHTSTKYQASQISGLANQIVVPQATPEAPIEIAHGWGTRRLRFFLEIQYNSQLYGSNSEYIMGYSEFSDLSINGLPDPRALFVVNSVSNVRHAMYNTGVQNQMATSVGDTSHIINNAEWAGPQRVGGVELMRPADVFSIITRQDIQPEMKEMGVFDQRVSMDSIPKKSFRGNAVASNYVSSILAGHQMAAQRGDFGASQNNTIEKARGYVVEPAIGMDFFLSTISEKRGSPLGNQFTLSDLKKLDPTFEERSLLVRLGEYANQVYSAGSAAGWHGTDLTTQIANILSQSVPALLMETGLTMMDFQCTNMGVIGVPVKTQVNNADGFARGLDYSRNIMLFIHRFEHELFRDLSRNNMFGLAVTMTVDILGETRVRVQVEGDVPVDYVTPSFCDALMTPIITQNPNIVTGLSMDMNNAMMQLNGDRVVSNAVSMPTAYQPSNF